ncbi:MAG: hypothetical protein JST43_09355 [Bacteroidetes bacterium]|nr:hypothetical protein [Bacteroidota bacterium]MBS1539055.1 hypothetical protein [Bacteroidota bacterium]
MKWETILLASVFCLEYPLAKAQKKMDEVSQWNSIGTLPDVDNKKQPGLAGAVVGVSENALIVGGGANFPDAMPWEGGKKAYHNEIFVFEKDKTGKAVHTGKIFHLPFGFAYGANCSTPWGVICAGGENEEGLLKKVIVVQWKPSAKEISIAYLPDLPMAVTNASIVHHDNSIFVAGGEVGDEVSDQFFKLDLQNQSADWQVLPSLPKPLSHFVMVSQNNGTHPCLYVAGGRKKNKNAISDISSSLYEFDLNTYQWTEKKQLPDALSAGTGLSYAKNKILMFGGDKGETFQKVEKYIAAIAQEQDQIKKHQLILEKNKLQSAHPGFSREVLQYNTDTDVWTVIGTIPFETPVTTTAVCWGETFVIPSGEIKAGVRSPHILGGKIK